MRTIRNVVRAVAAAVLIAALALAYDAPPSIGQPAPAPNPTALRAATVMVEATDEYGKAERGTGAVVDADGAILTARSIVARAVRIRVRYADGHLAPARLVASAEVADLALLHADTRRRAPWRLGDAARLRAGEEVGIVALPDRAVLDGGAVTFSLANVRAPMVGGMVWPFATATTPASEGAIVLNRSAEMVGVAFRASRLLDGRNFFVALRASAPLLADAPAAPAWLRAPAPGRAPAIVSHPYYPVAHGAVREGTLVMRAGAGELLRTTWSQTTEAVEPGPFGTLATHTFQAAGQRATHLTLLSAAGVRDVDPYAPPIRNLTPQVLLPARTVVGPFATWEGTYESAKRRTRARGASRITRVGFPHNLPTGVLPDCLEVRTEIFLGSSGGVAAIHAAPDVVRDLVYCRDRGPVLSRERIVKPSVEVTTTLERFSNR